MCLLSKARQTMCLKSSALALETSEQKKGQVILESSSREFQRNWDDLELDK